MSQVPAVVCAGVAALDMLAAVDALPPEDGRVEGRSGTLAGGGPAATAAVALARLGIPVAFVGAVGDDEAGTLIRGGLAREGVDVTLLRVVTGARSPMSIGMLRSQSTNTRTMVASSGSAGGPQLSAEVEDACRDAAWIHVDHAGWGLARELGERGVATPVSVDGGNPVPALELAGVALYAPTAAELLRWTGADGVLGALAEADARGAAISLATQGRHGATARTSFDPVATGLTERLGGGARARLGTGRWSVLVPALETAVVSTLGAGDVYHGSLIAAVVRGLALADAMAYAAVAAALSCRGIDGRSAIPTHEEVQGVLKTWDGPQRTVTGRIH